MHKLNVNWMSSGVLLLAKNLKATKLVDSVYVREHNYKPDMLKIEGGDSLSPFTLLQSGEYYLQISDQNNDHFTLNFHWCKWQHVIWGKGKLVLEYIRWFSGFCTHNILEDIKLCRRLNLFQMILSWRWFIHLIWAVSPICNLARRKNKETMDF